MYGTTPPVHGFYCQSSTFPDTLLIKESSNMYSACGLCADAFVSLMPLTTQGKKGDTQEVT